MIESCVAPRSERTARSRAAAPTRPGTFPAKSTTASGVFLSVRAWLRTILPFAPMKQCAKRTSVSEVFVSKASPMATPPSSSRRLWDRFSTVNVALAFSAEASALADVPRIEFQLRFKEVSVDEAASIAPSASPPVT